MIRIMKESLRVQATQAALLVQLSQGLLKLEGSPFLCLPVEVSDIFDKVEMKGVNKALLDKAFDAGLFSGVQVLDQDDEAGGVLYYLKQSETYLFAFCGTREDRGEWADNAQGMYSEESPLQRKAADYFDKKCAFIPQNAAVTVAGHSKGGNKVQFITMFASLRRRVSHCFCFNGQGFSHEAMEKMPLLEGYARQRALVTLIAGENDAVHPMGRRLAFAANTYYIRTDHSAVYEESNFIAEGHHLTALFSGDGDDLRPVLQEETRQGPVSKFSQSLSRAMMDMEPERLKTCTDGVMALMEGDQRALDYVDILWNLAYFAGPEVFDKLKNSPEGEALIAYLKEEAVKNAREEWSARLEHFWDSYDKLSDGLRSFATEHLEDAQKWLRATLKKLTGREKKLKGRVIKGARKTLKQKARIPKRKPKGLNEGPKG